MAPKKEASNYELWRKRNSESKIGHGFTKETIKKMSDAKKGKNHPNFGKHLSETTRNKISAANKGQIPWTYGKSSPMKGRHHSENTLLKMKESHKKRPPISDATRIKMRDAKKGKKMSNETKQKLREINKGCKLSEATLKKISDAIKGKNHPNWKGGIAYLPYCFKFNKRRRRNVRIFFKYNCLCCGKHVTENIVHWKNGYKQVDLPVHHIDHDKEQGCNGKPFNLITMCDKCHGKEQYYKQEYKDYINKTLEEGFKWGIWSREQYEKDVMYPE